MEAPLTAVGASSLLELVYTRFSHLDLGSLFPSSHHIEWDVSLNHHPQVSNRLPMRFKSGLCLGHSRRIVLKPLQCLGCVAQVIVMLRGDSSPQAQVACTVEQDYFQDLYVFGCIYHSLNLDQFP